MCAKKISINLVVQKLLVAYRMLLKLSPGVNFTNILHEAFMSEDRKSVKIQSSCQYLLRLGIFTRKSYE